jgi:hypothetical protein
MYVTFLFAVLDLTEQVHGGGSSESGDAADHKRDLPDAQVYG